MSMRKYVRGMAHAKLERRGIHGVNKPLYGKSYFARNWRKVAAEPMQPTSKRRVPRGAVRK